MAVNEKNILNRLYFVAGCMFIFALLVVYKLLSIQFIEGNSYRDLAEERTVKNVVIPASRGNVYAADGSLLATSIPKYDIRIDLLTPTTKRFNTYLDGLSDSLAAFHGKKSSHYRQALRNAKANKNRYYLLAQNLTYSEYLRFRNFPLLSLGAFKGGLIVEQKTKREHPLGAIAQRSIGYERFDEAGNVTRPGIEGAFGELYLRGKDGHRLKQRIGKGQWKPIRDVNEVEPQNGYDVYTTLDVNMQDIAHHSLLRQLELYEADHGCVVVMEVATGEIKAISNLGRTEKGTYYEKLNYAVGESQEPGSTFKVMALMAALEQGVVDTSTIVDTQRGSKRFYGRTINDTKGHGKISVARALEVSSNIGLATVIDESFSKKPMRFINQLKDWHLNDTLEIPIVGEGKPLIPEPGHSRWSRNALPSIAYGYNLKMTPLQILTFYNAIANNGEMIRPRFIKKVKEFDQDIEVFEKEVIDKKICSDKTLNEIRAILKNVLVRGTGRRMYSKSFSMAGKTGTARVEYSQPDWEVNRRYTSSFAGYFPAENPRYSCIVVINKPSTKIGYYGADVTGPVFKDIAQKIFTDTPIIETIQELDESILPEVEAQYAAFYDTAQKYKTIMPSVVGLPAMDAMSLLENMGVKVLVKGSGTVKTQSVPKGSKLKKNQTIVLELS